MNKKGISNLIAYVLLITITLSLSVMVYGWLKFYVQTDEVAACPDNVNIIVESYNCSGNTLFIRLKNKGLFSVDGFIIRTNNREGAKFGIHVLEEVNDELKPGEYFSKSYEFSGNPITLIDVQPFLLEEEKVICESYVSQKVECF